MDLAETTGVNWPLQIYVIHQTLLLLFALVGPLVWNLNRQIASLCHYPFPNSTKDK